MPSAFSRFLKNIALLFLVLAPAAFVFWQRQPIADRIKLFGYNPPTAVAALASQDTMTDAAKHIFYLNRPQIVADRAAFAKDCSVTEQAIVEGCYQSNENGIFIFDVTDKSLTGIQQVTAAHEMLHGAYDRLSNPDRSYVDGLLISYYKSGLTDSRIKSEIKLYQKTEPNDWVNEMHSVFGTEVGSLPAPLESYYKRYFTNRAKVVAYSDRYEAQFTSRIDQINSDDATLASMKLAIDSKQNRADQLSADLQTKQNKLEAERSSGNWSAYNSGVDSYNSEVDSYNALVGQIKYLVNQYNQLVQARNALAQNLRTLQGEIDTRVATKQAQ